MIKHVKRLWGYYLTLLILSITLFFPISWVYRFFRVSYGNDAAVISLTITIMTVMVFGIRGAVHTHSITRNLWRMIPSVDQHGRIIPLIFRIFEIDGHKPKGNLSEKKGKSDETDSFPQQLITFSKKHRGKQPRFPEEKIRKTVLKWENRDPSFSVATLEEFLAQEFGSGPDGILLMAPSTFYDWRRRILKEIESHVYE